MKTDREWELVENVAPEPERLVKNGLNCVRFIAFWRDHQKSLRPFLIPAVVFDWVDRKVDRFSLFTNKGTINQRRCLYAFRDLRRRGALGQKFSPNYANRVTDVRGLAEFLSGQFPEEFAALGRYCSEELVYGLMDHLDRATGRSGQNPNPNRDSRVNQRRRNQVVMSPGHQLKEAR